VRITLGVLSGEPGPRRDAILLNAGAGIYAANAAESIADGVAMATSAIDSGQAMACLERLVSTADDLEGRKAATPVLALEKAVRDARPAVSLRDRLAVPGMSVIAEIKRASPSRGRFPVTVDAAAVAREYLDGGAAAISVLTDEPYFQGSLGDLEAVAKVAHDAAEPAPVLRKDFVLDAYQVVEARARGADAILLIVAALSNEALADLLAVTRMWGMEALVEVHDEEEMARAIAVGAAVIGINNRDLKTFQVDLAVTERLAPLAPEGAVVVAESGVFGPQEVQRLAAAGADAVLVGEGLITASDRAAVVRALRA
jgi:indole-3-glycerol phosphate synthase